MSEQNAELTSNLAEAVAENEAKGDANAEADEKIGKLNEENEGLKNQLGQSIYWMKFVILINFGC